MRILLTGATGYIGKRLLPILLLEGDDVICLVRDQSRFEVPKGYENQVTVLEWDFLISDVTTEAFPVDIDVAYYLIHSMSTSISEFAALEEISVINFVKTIETTKARQVIYLSGIANEEYLSPHLQSRKNVEDVLMKSKVAATVLRAGIIVGSGSASFEIIRDLVEKLPIMIAPRWLNTRCQPIAIRDIIQFLIKVRLREDLLNMAFDVGGPDILTYRDMLLGYASVRGLKRRIYTIPIMTSRFSSYWLYFLTSTSYKLAANLADSMKIDVICQPNNLNELVGVKPITYKKALNLALARIIKHYIPSSWKDSLISSSDRSSLYQFTLVPSYGCLIVRNTIRILTSVEQAEYKVWSIGGKNGWYYATKLWKFKGNLDKLVGGIGLRRGRTHPFEIKTGDALDFWRVLIADKKNKRLLLFAEQRQPGEAWLEFRIIVKDKIPYLIQTATFRPSGLFGRIYWTLQYPVHYMIFRGMAKRIAQK